MSIQNALKRVHREMMMRLCPVKLVESYWRRCKGYDIDWDTPRDLNEKIQWLMRFTDTSSWSLCADKYRVREYVRSKGLGDLLVPLLGVWDRAEDIDFESLPDKFVIKCNHDSGSTHIVDKSQGFDPSSLRQDLARQLKVKYGYRHGELYYNRIKPMVIAEPFLEQDGCPFSKTIVDYKVWCFDGKPYSVWTCYDRSAHGAYVNLYDLDWNVHPEASVFTDHYRDGGGVVPKPANLDEMLSAASILSKGFPEVRVDFYECGGRTYFGEMTFSSLAGKMDYLTQAYLEELGSQCMLPPRK